MNSQCPKCGAPISEHAQSVGKCVNCSRQKKNRVKFK